MKHGIAILCATALAAVLAAPAGAAEAEKLLFGFEREEAEDAVKKMKKPESNFELLENGTHIGSRARLQEQDRGLRGDVADRALRHRGWHHPGQCLAYQWDRRADWSGIRAQECNAPKSG